MGKRIMHSARALFLTFLALEKSKRNSTFYEDYATAVERKNYAAAVNHEWSEQDLQRSETLRTKVRILFQLKFPLKGNFG
jgi:hypothetical protein